MRSFLGFELLERSLAFIFIFIFLIFTFFFTLSNQDELKQTFNRDRADLAKKMAREIGDLIDREREVTPRLSNAIADNSVVYAVLHFGDGSLLARSENYSIPVGIFEATESEALKAQYLTFIPFKDLSGRFSLVEVAMPIFTAERVKYLLRLGFSRNEEEDKLEKVALRNILVFSMVFVLFFSLASTRYFAAHGVRYTLVGSISLVMLLLFFSSTYVINNWYGSLWKNNFFLKDSLEISKMLIPSAKKIIENNEVKDFEDMIGILHKNQSFCYATVIKDDSYIYHVDKSKIGSPSTSENYRLSLSSDKPAIFNVNGSDGYVAMLPILNGNNRIGTLATLWESNGEKDSLSSLKDRLIMLFVFAYLSLFSFVYIFSEEIDRRIESQLSGLGLPMPNDTSKVSSNTSEVGEKRFVASVFIYFSGISEALNKGNSAAISEAVESCFISAKTLIKKHVSSYIKLAGDGIIIIFNNKTEQEALFAAVEFSKQLNAHFIKTAGLPFIPKITLNTCTLVELNVDRKEPCFLGDFLMDYKTIAKVQSFGEVILSQEAEGWVKNIAELETLEVLSPELGKFSVFILGDYKKTKELENIFLNSTSWTKIMILRILKSKDGLNLRKLEDWAELETDQGVKDWLISFIETKKY